MNVELSNCSMQLRRSGIACMIYFAKPQMMRRLYPLSVSVFSRVPDRVKRPSARETRRPPSAPPPPPHCVQSLVAHTEIASAMNDAELHQPRRSISAGSTCDLWNGELMGRWGRSRSRTLSQYRRVRRPIRVRCVRQMWKYAIRAAALRRLVMLWIRTFRGEYSVACSCETNEDRQSAVPSTSDAGTVIVA